MSAVWEWPVFFSWKTLFILHNTGYLFPFWKVFPIAYSGGHSSFSFSSPLCVCTHVLVWCVPECASVGHSTFYPATLSVCAHRWLYGVCLGVQMFTCEVCRNQRLIGMISWIAFSHYFERRSVTESGAHHFWTPRALDPPVSAQPNTREAWSTTSPCFYMFPCDKNSSPHELYIGLLISPQSSTHRIFLIPLWGWISLYNNSANNLCLIINRLYLQSRASASGKATAF